MGKMSKYYKRLQTIKDLERWKAYLDSLTPEQRELQARESKLERAFGKLAEMEREDIMSQPEGGFTSKYVMPSAIYQCEGCGAEYLWRKDKEGLTIISE